MWVTIILIIFSIYAVLNWIIWKINAQAILLFCLESGGTEPDPEQIKKYRNKVIEKHFKTK